MIGEAFLRMGMTLVITCVMPQLMNVVIDGAGIPLDGPLGLMVVEIQGWAMWFMWIGAGLSILAWIPSFAGSYADVLSTVPTKPQTVKDHFLLLAEHDSAIAYAAGVIKRLDETIALRWPSRKP
jgi:hypothetical protein